MKIGELLDYYRTYANMSRKLELGGTTYMGWVKKGYIPFTTQCVIEQRTNKKFKASRMDCKPLDC